MGQIILNSSITEIEFSAVKMSSPKATSFTAPYYYFTDSGESWSTLANLQSVVGTEVRLIAAALDMEIYNPRIITNNEWFRRISATEREVYYFPLEGMSLYEVIVGSNKLYKIKIPELKYRKETITDDGGYIPGEEEIDCFRQLRAAVVNYEESKLTEVSSSVTEVWFSDQGAEPVKVWPVVIEPYIDIVPTSLRHRIGSATLNIEKGKQPEGYLDQIEKIEILDGGNINAGTATTRYALTGVNSISDHFITFRISYLTAGTPVVMPTIRIYYKKAS